MGKLKDTLRKSRIRIAVPGIVYEISPDEIFSNKSVDERIYKLEKVRNDLLDAVGAVESLQDEAQLSKSEVEKLKEKLEKLREDKETTERLLKVPEESFARVLDKASSKAQWRGLVIGFFLGFLASLLATAIWEFTVNSADIYKNITKSYK